MFSWKIVGKVDFIFARSKLNALLDVNKKKTLNLLQPVENSLSVEWSAVERLNENQFSANTQMNGNAFFEQQLFFLQGEQN